MLHKLWLLFAQAATVCVAAVFIVGTLKPEWLAYRADRMFGTPSAPAPIPIQEANERVDAPKTEQPGSTNPVSSYSDAVQHATPSVVNIFTTKEVRLTRNPLGNDPFFRRFFGDQLGTQRQQSSSLGSGVIVSTLGYILTNNHVVAAADEIEVALADGRKATATVVGADPDTDLAIIKIDLPNLPSITFGRIEEARVGDVVLAIGNPFGVGQTVTMGIISALGRNHLGVNTFENFIQTDAAINPGNSGGALVDTSGNLLGINAVIYSRTGGSLGIGFAVPVSTAKQVMESIIATGQVVRGYIGVEPQDITADMAEALKLPRTAGAMIAGVQRNGPADKAGLKPGDILIGVDDNPVADTASMLNLVAQLKPGNSAKLKIVRGNSETDLTVNVGKRPKALPAADE